MDTYTTILITGATGSWGQAAVKFLLDHTEATIRCFSRDWVKQAEMAERFDHHARLRFLLGDVVDTQRLQVAMDGVDLVFHAAALKQVTAGEYNISEVTKTNILGTERVAQVARLCDVKRVVFLSSDKACLPQNSYGISKAYGERTMIQANGYAPYRTVYCCVRYGNVHGSRGSVVEAWEKALKAGHPLKVTDLGMSRFFLTIEEAVACAWDAAYMAPRGGILVPHLPAYTLRDLAEALQALHGVPEVSYLPIGVRQGEKWHEDLMTESEGQRLAIYGQRGEAPLYYCVMPELPTWEIPAISTWKRLGGWQWHTGTLGADAYNSGTWPWRLSAEALQDRLRMDDAATAK